MLWDIRHFLEKLIYKFYRNLSFFQMVNKMRLLELSDLIKSFASIKHGIFTTSTSPTDRNK